MRYRIVKGYTRRGTPMPVFQVKKHWWSAWKDHQARTFVH